MIRKFFLLYTPIAILLCFFQCKQQSNPYQDADKIAVSWELVSNFTDTPNVFEAQIALENRSGIKLSDKNWALFFNMAPRDISEPKASQAAYIEHINGDWYKLIPNPGFELMHGEKLEINYWGHSPVIKESDAPLGLYFVFYDESGDEAHIAPVQDYTIKPFEREEQILRGSNDHESPDSPAKRYEKNLDLQLISADQLLQIIPSPVKIHKREGTFILNKDVTINHEAGLDNEANFLQEKLKSWFGINVSISEEKPNSSYIHLKTTVLKVNGVEKEAYHLHINDKGVSISGNDAAGVFYGIQSMLALIPVDSYHQSTNEIHLPVADIQDAPRFAFRGLHMDVCRNFQSKETILRILDLMSFYKLNQFLFYLTEDEGWRIEIEGLPELTEIGARRHHSSGKETATLHPAYGSGPVADNESNHGSGYYTREDFIEILQYADARHITVIPQVNFPGHARAAIKAMEARYQRLMEAGKEEAANEYRLIDPEDVSIYSSAQKYTDNVVSVARESTYHFYEKVVDEIIKMYQEAGIELKVFHTGGDEVPEGAWTKSPMAANLLEQLPEIEDPKNLQAYFFREIVERLQARNLQAHGWEEVALVKSADGRYLPNPEFAGGQVVPYIWNNMFDYPDLGYQLANAGYPVVLCNVSNFYFDLAYSNDPKEPGLYWGGFVNTRDAWTFAPFDFSKTTTKNVMGKPIDIEKANETWESLQSSAQKNIIGLQAQLWSETIKGRDMLEYYMLPKLFGFAESAWAPEKPWESLTNHDRKSSVVTNLWNVFANTLGQKEIARLSTINGGYNYRLPLPGAKIVDSQLMANIEFPGLEIIYTTDGTEPDADSGRYKNPVMVTSKIVKLRSIDASGKMSRTVVVENPDQAM